ncbi:MAG: aldo/keto reductase [Clostridiales bacterium]|nr:aldo/keto reductase [Clostridiales bacterium]
MSYTADEKRYEKMKYNKSGRSGLKLPTVSLGLWHNFGRDSSYENMKAMCFAAFDCGITHFDIANNYGPEPGDAERNFGRIIKEELSRYRDELIISTKAGYGMWGGPYGDGGSRKYLLASLDRSLERLGLPYVDIFYHHRPDRETPLEETMSALDTAVKSGRALYVGLSNYSGEEMKKAAAILREMRCPFVINQNSYSIINRTIERNGLKAAAKEEGVGLIVFSPLAQGLLTNRYLNGIPEGSRAAGGSVFLRRESVTPERVLQAKKLNEIAKSRGQTLAQMALSWVMKDGEVTSVLIGASSPEQIRENAEIVKASPFTDEELCLIDEIAGESPRR